MTITEASRAVGREVVYCPHPGGTPERGVITAVGPYYVLVRYGSDAYSKATEPLDLDLVRGGQ